MREIHFRQLRTMDLMHVVVWTNRLESAITCMHCAPGLCSLRGLSPRHRFPGVPSTIAWPRVQAIFCLSCPAKELSLRHRSAFSLAVSPFEATPVYERAPLVLGVHWEVWRVLLNLLRKEDVVCPHFFERFLAWGFAALAIDEVSGVFMHPAKPRLVDRLLASIEVDSPSTRGKAAFRALDLQSKSSHSQWPESG